MIEKVNLTQASNVLLPFSTVILPEKELRLVFNTSSVGHGKLIANVNGEDINAAGGLDLSPFLREGIIRISLSLIVDAFCVKKWMLSPILVEKVDTGYKAIPELLHLEEKIEALTEELGTVKKAIIEINTKFEGETL